MSSHGSPVPGQVIRAVLLDALGTLVELADPFSVLERELQTRGAPVDPAGAQRALIAEMTYYRANLHSAVDEPSLDRLRDRCAEVLHEALPSPARELPHEEVRASLLAAMQFRAFPDAIPALDALRAAGLRLAVVSNWDVSLLGVLRDTGLAERVDVVVTSAQEGVAKPDPAIFALALERLGGLRPDEALHVGDDPHGDVEGARGAGIAALLIDRAGDLAPPGESVIAALTELPGRLGSPPEVVP